MKKSNNKNKKLNSKLFVKMGIALGFCALVVVLVITSVFNARKVTEAEDSKFEDYNAVYNGSQVQIKSFDDKNDGKTISITDAAADADTDYSSYVITISSGEELYLFSQLCDSLSNSDSYKDYLSYDYKLLCNIDYDDETANQFIPIGWGDTAFSGTFDGQGYDITDLNFVIINSTTAKTYATMDYFAMFSKNSGTVENFGLIDPSVRLITLADGLKNTGVANICGLNTGEIYNVYVNQLSTTLNEECGITAGGGYRIAGLVVANQGKLENSYIATNSVYNASLDDVIEFADICLTATTTKAPTNCYFYDSSINFSSSTQTTNGAYSFVYVDDLGVGSKSGSVCYGEMITDLDDLNAKYATNSAWSVATSGSGKLSDYYTNETPIMRSISFDGNTITISDVNEFVYAFELMNNNAYFASGNVTYTITKDLDLSGIPSKAYCYSHAFGANVVGDLADGEEGSSTLVNNQLSPYPTIYNADLVSSTRKVTTVGLDAYGLFPYLTGSVSNLNIVGQAVNLDTIKSSDNAKAIGAVAGYIEGGSVTNVNVYMSATASSAVLGEYYLGGICGVLGGEGSISSSTTAGSFNLSAITAFTAKTGYMSGIAVGGAVGYAEDSLGDLDTVLNGINITTALGSSAATYAIGGVVGAGYTRTASNLENQGTITIGKAGTAPSYDTLYVAGIIGRHLGVTKQVGYFENQGEINVYGSTTATMTYVAGIENADIQTSATAKDNVTASQFVSKDGNTVFYASALTNRANINVLENNLGANLEYTSGLNVISSNGFISEISSLYNLDNNNVIDLTSSSTTVARKVASIGSQSIDATLVSKYAGALNAVGGTASSEITLKTAYNLKNIVVTTSDEVSNDIKYAGVVLGNYINYENVRNEGDITATITKAVGTSSASKTIKLIGVMEEVSAGTTADTIYNGGNITVNYSADIYANIYTSGICYANRNGYSSVAAFDPSSTSYDEYAEGSLNDAINNGKIMVTDAELSSISYTLATYWDSAASNKVINTYGTTYTGASVYGNIYSSGVTYINESVITNTFNLGDVSSYNYSKSTTTPYEISSAGIANISVGAYAVVENSANNGAIIAANLSNGSYTTGDHDRAWSSTNEIVTKTIYLADVTSAGIVARNDATEAGAVGTSSGNSSQIISFTINYGSVIAYNMSENITLETSRLTSKAAGILGVGLANVINVTNYGNIYGSEISAGIFGAVYLSYYESEIASNTVSIANTIDYGNVYFLAKGYSITETSKAYNYITYADFVKIESTPDSIDSFTMSTAINSIAYEYSTKGSITFLSYGGAVIGYINFNNSASASNINIRYLLNFYEGLPLAGIQINVPTMTADTTTIYSAYSTMSTSNAIVRDNYLSTYVNYSPLTTSAYSELFMSTYGDNATQSTITGYGLFSENFMFRQVVEGLVTDGTTYFNTTTYPTDKYLTDYFQYVSYAYVNDVLMDKIGWKTLAYLNAATDFAESVSGMNLFLTKYKSDYSTEYESLMEDAFQTSTWSQYANTTILHELLTSLIDGQSETDIEAVISFLFSDDCSNYGIINSTFRAEIVEYMFTNYPDLINSASIISFANSYSATLADILCGTDENNAKSYVKENLNTVITSLGATTKKQVFMAYVDCLKDTGSSFWTATSTVARYQLLLDMFSKVDESDSIWASILELFSDDNQKTINNFTSTLDEFGGFNNLTDDEKTDLLTNIIKNNDTEELSTYLTTFASDIGMFDYLAKVGYETTSFSEINSGIAYTNTSNTDNSVTAKRVKLWNQIKDTTIFQNYFTSLYSGTDDKYYLATEVNNTYQTTTNPDISSDYDVLSNNVVVGHKQITQDRIGTDQDMLYIYTETITPQTYFLGPYVDDEGTLVTSYISTQITASGMSKVKKVYDTKLVTDIALNSVIYTSYSSKYVSVVIGADENVNSLKSVYSGTTGTNSGYKLFYNESGRQQFASTEGLSQDLGNNQGGVTILGENTATLTSGSKTYSLNKAVVSYRSGSTFTIKENGSSTEVTISGSFSINGTTYSNANGWNYIWNNYTIPMYFASTTTSWHPTGYSGLYMLRNDCSNGHYFLFDGGGKYSEIITTRYIDYTAAQILALDGYLTQYSDGTTEDATERSIINQIFNNFLLTDTNRTNFTKVVEAALMESINNKASSTDKINFINAIVVNGVETSKTINSTKPLAYLIKEGSTTVSSYLSGKNTISGTKKNILNAAASNRDIFVELMEILFDTELTYDTSESSGSGDNLAYGGNFDIDNLLERLEKIADNQYSDTPSSSLPKVIPGKNLSYTNDTGETQNSYTSLCSGEMVPLKVTPSSTYTGSDAKEITSSQNIGYYLGNQNKINKKSIKFCDYTSSSDSAKTTYSWTSGSTPRTFFTRTGDNATTTTENIKAMTADEIAALPEGIRNLLPSSNTTVEHSMIRLSCKYEDGGPGTDLTKYGLKSSMDYYGTTYTSVYLPNNGIWFKPRNVGTIRFVIYSGSNGQNFTMYRLSRSSYPTSNPFSSGITGHSYSDTIYHTTTLALNCLYYFEYKVTETDIANNTEFLLGNEGQSNGAYFLYLDMGIDGGTSKATQYSAVETAADNLNLPEYLDNFITYLVPLEGKDSDGNYVGILTYTPATSYSTSKDYFVRSGTGTSSDPYVYTNVDSSSVTATNYSDYYFKDTVTVTIQNFQNALFTTSFKTLVVAESNSATLALIKSLTNADDLEKVVLKLSDINSKIFDSIETEYYKIPTEGTDAQKQLLTAGYLASNYYKVDNDPDENVSSTVFNSCLKKLSTDYQYINSDGSIDNTKFEAFCKYIGYDLDTIQFGIFALASSTGIENGTFIPDNIDLEAMDTDVNYNLLATDAAGVSIIALTDANSTTWRDNNGLSTKGDANTDVESSVNYAFKVEMKQLKLAISTTIFEMDLTTPTSSYLLYADDSNIDCLNGVITYYVPSTELTTLKTSTSVAISKSKIADTATFVTNNSNTTTVNLTGGTTDADGNYTVTDVIIVTAEDENVYKKYSMVFIPVSEIGVEITSATPNPLGYAGGQVTISVTTTNITDGFDLSQYLTITNGSAYTLADENAKFSLDTKTANNGIVNSNAATLVINVEGSMPGGELELSLSFLGVSDTYAINKTLATGADIVKFGFEGQDLTSNGKFANTESDIKFGRAYDYTELTDYTSDDFYLYEFEISPNATVAISAEKKAIKVGGVDTGRIQYIVTYVVTAENGTTKNTYTHTLNELDYFTGAYANLYKEGESLSDEDLYDETFAISATDTLDGSASSLTYASGDVNFAAVSFNRGVEPEYRIKYILNNFYTLGENVTYYATEDTKKNGAAVTESYRGLTVVVTEENEPGTYKFEYVYKNTGTWNGETYTREYTLPTLYIVEDYSTNALLTRLTFLDQSIVVGNTATVMKPQTEESSSMVYTKTGTSYLDGTEAVYDDLFKNSSKRTIEIKGKTIKYNNDSDATSISDYYAIGTVSDSDLTYYAPTFGIESHAQIYQYTTVKKLQSYGLDSQTEPDKDILTDHDMEDILLYVPFTNGTANVNYLVQLDADGNWTKVYTTAYNGTDQDALVGTYSKKFTTLDVTNGKADATINGYSVITAIAGNPTENSSLYMDYVGNPLENHFWYVSYLVFSESALHGDFAEGNVRFYHISIIDATNTVYFDVTLYAPTAITQSTLYMTISENIYGETTTLQSTRQISGWLVDTEETDTDSDSPTYGYKKYLLRYNLQILPKGYFSFYIDLPNGYTVTAYTDMENQLDTSSDPGKNEEGTFLPFTSLITKTIKLTFVVNTGTNADAAVWAVTTSDIYTRSALLAGNYNVVVAGNTVSLAGIIPASQSGTVTWTTSDDTVATVEDGTVTGVAEGTVLITGTVGGHSYTCAVHVSAASN